jgi:hypothetical protein
LYLAGAFFFPNPASKVLVHLPPWSLMFFWFGSIPIWSICFGWLFIRTKDWLNHFPVLGKRVF